jgi:hypothetical protein
MTLKLKPEIEHFGQADLAVGKPLGRLDKRHPPDV